jgi:flagellar motor protein MotB
LNAVGMGAIKPKGDNSTEEGRMLNRRVEVKLVESEKTETIRTQSQNPINN